MINIYSLSLFFVLITSIVSYLLQSRIIKTKMDWDGKSREPEFNFNFTEINAFSYGALLVQNKTY